MPREGRGMVEGDGGCSFFGSFGKEVERLSRRRREIRVALPQNEARIVSRRGKEVYTPPLLCLLLARGRW